MPSYSTHFEPADYVGNDRVAFAFKASLNRHIPRIVVQPISSEKVCKRPEFPS